MTKRSLKRLLPDNLPTLLRDPVTSEVLTDAAKIVEDVRDNGKKALLSYAKKFDNLQSEDDLVLDKEALRKAFDSLEDKDKLVLELTSNRIREFAKAQKNSLKELSIDVPGGKAGHTIAPVETAGCYAPGGRFPLPSSVMMTAITAGVAGVETVWVASPNPSQITKAAAYISKADALLCAGGAQAISSFAYGIDPAPKCDVIVGPGNKWVTAAKKIVSGIVAIDMLAGPSELLVIADGSADSSIVAADLLAQAEHDVEAMPVLVTTDALLADDVDREIEKQLSSLTTKNTASKAVKNGFCCVVSNLDEAADISNKLAPEHLELIISKSSDIIPKLKNYGALFIGSLSAEVIGDYGIGPNHTLPTGGTARYTGGLSVMNFLRVRTWIELSSKDDAKAAYHDAVKLARLEGLEAHARAAEKRIKLT